MVTLFIFLYTLKSYLIFHNGYICWANWWTARSPKWFHAMFSLLYLCFRVIRLCDLDILMCTHSNYRMKFRISRSMQSLSWPVCQSGLLLCYHLLLPSVPYPFFISYTREGPALLEPSIILHSTMACHFLCYKYLPLTTGYMMLSKTLFSMEQWRHFVL
jgi:hypothetical protein